MTEPVIDIRDRIEKMRNQMTIPGGQRIPDTKQESSQILDSKKEKENNTHTPKSDLISKSEKITQKQSQSISDKISEKKKEFNKDFDNKETITKISIQKENNKSKSDYSEFYERQENKENIFKNENQSVKTDETTFPQFSLNVSNPISWKLMLLIMVMQLLTNIMLVVVLYLK